MMKYLTLLILLTSYLLIHSSDVVAPSPDVALSPSTPTLQGDNQLDKYSDVDALMKLANTTAKLDKRRNRRSPRKPPSPGGALSPSTLTLQEDNQLDKYSDVDALKELAETTARLEKKRNRRGTRSPRKEATVKAATSEVVKAQVLPVVKVAEVAAKIQENEEKIQENEEEIREDLLEAVKAVTKIQSLFRRKKHHTETVKAVTKIQSVFRGNRARYEIIHFLGDSLGDPIFGIPHIYLAAGVVIFTSIFTYLVRSHIISSRSR